MGIDYKSGIIFMLGSIGPHFIDKFKNAILNSTTARQNLFINIFVDSDHDETTGFVGYNYRYLLTHSNSNSHNDNKLNSFTTNFSSFIPNQSNHTDSGRRGTTRNNNKNNKFNGFN
jgi:hypothetical protein